MKKKILNALLLAVWIVSLAAIITPGCVTPQPGADPFVIKVEQSQSLANATVQFVLDIDNSNRPFWRTNAPAYHQFCEWLRTPVPWGNPPTNTLVRALAIQWNVQEAKLAYKQNRGPEGSNTLFAAWSLMNTVINQSVSWSNIVTQPVHP